MLTIYLEKAFVVHIIMNLNKSLENIEWIDVSYDDYIDISYKNTLNELHGLVYDRPITKWYKSDYFTIENLKLTQDTPLVYMNSAFSMMYSMFNNFNLAYNNIPTYGYDYIDSTHNIITPGYRSPGFPTLTRNKYTLMTWFKLDDPEDISIIIANSFIHLLQVMRYTYQIWGMYDISYQYTSMLEEDFKVYLKIRHTDQMLMQYYREYNVDDYKCQIVYKQKIYNQTYTCVSSEYDLSYFIENWVHIVVKSSLRIDDDQT